MTDEKPKKPRAPRKAKVEAPPAAPVFTAHPVVERLVNLNRDHHARMADGSKHARADPAHSERIARLDAQSRANVCNAMLGAAGRLSIQRGGELLELGAGFAGDRETLVQAFAAQYTGIEVVPEVAAASGVLNLAIETMPGDWTGRFRWIYSRHVMEHVASAADACRELARVLAPEGVLGAVTPHYFPDPEPAHICQLRIDEWMAAYRGAGLVPVYSTQPKYTCPEAHIVCVHRAHLEQLVAGMAPGRERTDLQQLLR